MFDVKYKEINWAGKKLKLETGRLARQADGSVLVSYGDTTVLCTAVAQKIAKPGIDFFPLTVNYQEKSYAAGKIPGGFFKREGRPGEKETLTSRLIDRPIRPLFHSKFKNETQVICTVLSHDLENNPDIPSLVGASAALTISGMPFLGPLGAARVGYIDKKYVLNPTADEMTNSELDLVVAGTKDAVLMVESEAKELSEEVMLGAVMFGHEKLQDSIQAIIDLAEHSAKDPWDLPEVDDNESLHKDIHKLISSDIEQAYKETAKQQRSEKLSEIRSRIQEEYSDDESISSEVIADIVKSLEKNIVRTKVLKTGKRIDGRGLSDIRPIVSETDIFPRVHGSAVFTRGETQSLSVTTLGTSQDEQIFDALEGEYRERFMLHYNFPPYSTGEVKFMMSPGRREIGHGKLAWRALNPLLPSKDDFPYTIRVVSEITESNGSSSMATVCASSLSLMSAGVPMKSPCAGIAMGLILEEDGHAVLSDILGDEDHLGDMDFKVAGTKDGVTALQMDIKITGITKEIMDTALNQANEGRMHILGKMSETISEARESVNDFAPRITTINIPKDKIRDVIGSGGKVIREITETTGAKIDIDDEGIIKVASPDNASSEAALDWIKNIVAEPEVGVIYQGKVVKVVEFGAFVNFIGNRDGLLHISELSQKRVAKVTDVVNEGDQIWVKVLALDDRGKIRLSIKSIDQSSGSEIEEDNDT
ncbi:MAG: Polyribonucleotide nucleotidyltransferase [Alphaproteobacteria bacterium MarineAlpha2_Bin1]|nr:MAG: Polyribonucleotide nucleotidyltransferase [Alphaproteobacteria bacterium MarineAlpha2_Bin1]|tara:strand:+ start:72 stop:2189 length:2118 start_codon:yes stop_codon:yes gene_type:complete